MTKMNKWQLEQDDLVRRRLGKTAEELAELLAVVSRAQIQGLDAVDPGTGKTNRARMQEETADVYAQLAMNRESLRMDHDYIASRTLRKVRQMREWEALYRDDDPGAIGKGCGE